MNTYPTLPEKRKVNLFLMSCAAFCFLLSITRAYFTHSYTFVFLNWNLFLAFIPWAVTDWYLHKFNGRDRWWRTGFMLGIWLLFFPNAPYILTDLFHLSNTHQMPKWFDLLLILSYAWTGLLFGLFSLWNTEEILARVINRRVIPFISSALLFLGSYGVYLGRFPRWNSWDLFTRPGALMHGIGQDIFHPMHNPRAIGMTLLMGLFLNMVYWSLRVIRQMRHAKS